MPSILVGGLKVTPSGGSIAISILVVDVNNHQRRRRCAQTYSLLPLEVMWRRATGESGDGGAGSGGESTIAWLALIEARMIPLPSDVQIPWRRTAASSGELSYDRADERSSHLALDRGGVPARDPHEPLGGRHSASTEATTARLTPAPERRGGI